MNNRALHRFATLTAAATLVLLGAGGLVTSHGVGMAVPDWPNTFGYNMFFFPFSKWVGGVFYEHSHRLLASGVGLLTSILAIWLYGMSARPFLRWAGLGLMVLGLGTSLGVPQRWPDALVLGVSGAAALAASMVWPRSEPAPKWQRRLGVVAFLAIVLQGVLGGLRVVLFKDEIGIFHAMLAQLFFALTCALALFTGRWWQERFGSSGGQLQNSTRDGGDGRIPLTPALSPGERGYPPQSVSVSKIGWLCLGATLLIFAQLVLGATMRHRHAGLAIPDFPLAYGKIWPAMDPQSVALYNQQRMEVLAVNPITSTQIALQMVHRIMAVFILTAIACCAWLAVRQLGLRHIVARLALAWLGLVAIQILLGAATIWSNKAADIATGHVLAGALSLALGSIVSLISMVEAGLVRRAAFFSLGRSADSSDSFGARPSPAIALE